MTVNAGIIQIGQPAPEPKSGSLAPAKPAARDNADRSSFLGHIQDENKPSIADAAAGPDSSRGENLSAESLSRPSVSVPESLLKNQLVDEYSLQTGQSSIAELGNASHDVNDDDLLQRFGEALPGLEEILEQSPALAMLTGRLEFVEPAAIPETVSANSFIRSGISAQDIDSFMSTPQSLGGLMDALGLPQGMKDLAAQAGFDLQQDVTPQTLLKQLGIDPGVVSTELKLMGANLQLEGVSQYMKRAAKLREGRSDLIASSSHDAVNAEPSRKGNGFESSRAQDSAFATGQIPGVKPADVPGEESRLLSTDGLSSRFAADHAPRELTGKISSPAPGREPNFQQVQTDPTQGLKQTMERMENVQTFNAQSMNQPESNVQKLSPPSELGSNGQLMGLDQEIGLQQSWQNGPTAAVGQNASKDLNQNIMDRLMAAQVAAPLNEQSDSGFDSQSEQGFGQGSPFDLSLNALATPGGTTTSAAPQDFSELLQQPDAAPEVVHKAVIDKAEMLVKDGGGQIKMDIGGGEGKVELAMDVVNNEVSLRLVASSEQVKDLLAADLPKLREALSQQNLQLTEVELGSHSEKEWSNGSFDQGNFQKEFAEQKQQFSQTPSMTKKSASKSYTSISAFNPAAMNRARHGGQIQVFA